MLDPIENPEDRIFHDTAYFQCHDVVRSDIFNTLFKDHYDIFTRDLRCEKIYLSEFPIR